MAWLHTDLSCYRGERDLAKQLASLPDPRLHLWFGLSYLPGCQDIDSLLWHEAAGVFVVEVKAVSLDMVEEYSLPYWKCRGRKKSKSPPCQAFDALEGFRLFLTRQLPAVPFLVGTACWPLISRADWRGRWDDALLGGDYSERMLFIDDIQHGDALRDRLAHIYQNPPVRSGAHRPFRHSPDLLNELRRILSHPTRSPATTSEPADEYRRFRRVEALSRLHDRIRTRADGPETLGDVLNLVEEAEAYYARERSSDLPSPGSWGAQIAFMEQLQAALADVEKLDPADLRTWDALVGVEARLKDAFDEVAGYGPLSLAAMDDVQKVAREMYARCREVDRALTAFVRTVNRMTPEQRTDPRVTEAIGQFRRVKEEIVQDLSGRKQFQELSQRIQTGWERFLELRAFLRVQRNHRPALQHLDRFGLSERQERLVARDYQGELRIQGASGSGKTIILLHRALRLARENPSTFIRVFTINRSLAELLQASCRVINGFIPENMVITCFYDFLLGCLARFDFQEKYRLVDDRSGERIEVAWRDFYNHRGTDEQTNVFAGPNVAKLRDSLQGRTPPIDACRYLRDEVSYIQSARLHSERIRYLSADRPDRGIALLPQFRRACLDVAEAWEEWLEVGDLCDIDTLTLQAADYFYDDRCLRQIRSLWPTGFVFIDEVQDFSTLELSLVRRLVHDPEVDNCFFFVGDVNQKVYAKHHSTVEAGFGFRGKAVILTQNYRNTRQILQAAYLIAAAFPPQGDEQLQIVHPELSPYEGGRPVLIRCREEAHLKYVLALVERRRGSRTAIVSENDHFLAALRREAEGRGFRCFELFRNEEIDLWRQQEGDSLSASLVVSRMEAVKGFEFDTVIVCDLSAGVSPRRGSPPEEYWREAAVVYCALTRARDELLLTCVGEPSVFLECMRREIDQVDISGAIGECAAIAQPLEAP